MPKIPSQPVARKPRTDARRSRGRILEAVKEAFPRFCAEASLGEIAKQVDVGPGTLNRHFPARDALIETAYRSEVEKLTAEAKFAKTLSPSEALQAWMFLFVEHIAPKQIIASALNSLVGGLRSYMRALTAWPAKRLMRWLATKRQEAGGHPARLGRDLISQSSGR